MDPLIRKVNSDDTIEGLNIGNPILIDKLCGYAKPEKPVQNLSPIQQNIRN